MENGGTLDLSCSVLPETAEDAAWLHRALRSGQLRRVSFRGCVFPHDTVANHAAFVSRLGSSGLAAAVEWMDLRGLRPDEAALLSLVASLAHHKKMELVVGAVPKSLGLKLLERAGTNVSLGFGGDAELALVRGRRIDFAAVAELVKSGETAKIGGIRSECDDAVDRTLVASKSACARPKKPWEKDK
jgi:hypothetical protein